MHRETTISREIKLLKNKFELLEKSRQFRSLLQKSNTNTTSDLAGADDSLAFDSSMNDSLRTRSEGTSEAGSYPGERTQSSAGLGGGLASSSQQQHSGRSNKKKSVHIKLSKLHTLGRLFAPLFGMKKSANKVRRRRSNRVSSIGAPPLAANSSAGLGGLTDAGDPMQTTASEPPEGASQATADGGAAAAPENQPSPQPGDPKPAQASKKKRSFLKRIMFIA